MELWVIMYCSEDCNGDFAESVEGVFEGTREEVIEYKNKRDAENDGVGFYTYYLAPRLN